MSKQYKLVNPVIKGNLKTLFTEKSHFDAAQKCWEKLSSHFTNNVPLFAFSLQRVNDNQLFHFTVKENKKDGNVMYNIKELNLQLNKEEENDFKNAVTKAQQGGRKSRYNDNADDSSSDDELKSKYNKMLKGPTPISWWWYYPIPYKLDTVFIPTFAVPLTPYVEIQYSTTVYPWYSN